MKSGLDHLECGWVLIHDGARPFVDAAMIERGLAAALESGAAIAAVPVKDTIKVGDEQGFVRQTLKREALWVVQTPQVFRRSLLLEAYAVGNEDVTDDASLVEQAGGRVKLFAGDECNIKVTTPEDLLLAELLMARRTRDSEGQ